MTISKDLFLAILSMDAYNRGYNEGISGLGGIESKIGAATLKKQSNIQENSTEVNASFYAVAYDVDGTGIDGLDSTTVISYRGTDKPADDIVTGWTLALGYSEASQAGLAIKFFEAVTQKNAFDASYGFEGPELVLDPTSTSGYGLTVTGHSLGGILAGFISNITGADGQGYDHAPFGVAALAALVSEAERKAGELGLDLESFTDANGDPLPSEEIFAQLGINTPDFDLFKGIAVELEALAGARNGLIAGAITAFLRPLLGNPVAQVILSYLGYTIASGQIASEANIAQETLSTFGWNAPGTITNPATVNRHSASLLTILQYDKDQQTAANAGLADDWRVEGVVQPLLDALFDDNIGLAAGVLGVSGDKVTNGKYADVMAQTIAYSALDGSEGLVFGNTGIRAMFDDANQLGQLVTADKLSDALTDQVDDLTKAIVQFAGQMALQKVDYTGNDLNPEQGILHLSAGGAASETAALIHRCAA